METDFFFFLFLSLSDFCKQMGDDGFRKQKGGKGRQAGMTEGDDVGQGHTHICKSGMGRQGP